MMARIALLALLAASACAVVSAHSWVECADWRFNNAAAMTDASLRRWSDADGTCYGYARKFEYTAKPFGKMDQHQFFRGNIQDFSAGAAACRHNDASTSASGSSEGTQSPRSKAYAPNANVYGQPYGAQTSVVAGQTLCWRWPAKNHIAHVTTETDIVFVNWDDQADRVVELNQAQMDTKRLTTFKWANCPVMGPADSTDQTGVGSALAPCGGCFTVPNYAAGTYTVQWEWPFHGLNNAETYTSCMDITIKASSGSADCAVSGWSAWGSCSGNCGGGTQQRTRTVTTAQSGSGAGCPTLVDAQTCNTQSCSTNNYISQHLVYDDSMVAGFQDWSWAAAYSLADTSFQHSGSSSIRLAPTHWDGVSMYNSAGAMSAADYQSISFWVNGGASSGQLIQFCLFSTNPSLGPVLTYPVPASSVKAYTWTLVSVRFADLGMSSGYFNGIWWQGQIEGAQSPVYIDDVYFMHVHAGGAQAAVVTDLCANVTCSGQSVCLGGSCICTGGYSGVGCASAPSISSVTVKSLAGATLTTLSADVMVTIAWASAGTLQTVSLQLIEAGSAIPTVIATQITNAGSYSWEVPSTLAAGNYSIRVVYSATVSAFSATLVKTQAAAADSCPDCNGHGVCDEDTSSACVCRYSYSGTTCSVAPSGVTKLRVPIIVGAAYATYTSAPAKFKQVFQVDMASALKVTTDQVEVVSVARRTDTSSTVTFDIVSGGSFQPSALSINSTETFSAAVNKQLASSDSSINRATYSYALTSSTGKVSGAGRAHAGGVAVAAAAVLAVVMALAM